MTVAFPPVLTRAAFVDARGVLTRDAVNFLSALRTVLGGDATPVLPSTADALAPVSVAQAAPDALGPVAIFTAGGDLAPVGGA